MSRSLPIPPSSGGPGSAKFEPWLCARIAVYPQDRIYLTMVFLSVEVSVSGWQRCLMQSDPVLKETFVISCVANTFATRRSSRSRNLSLQYSLSQTTAPLHSLSCARYVTQVTYHPACGPSETMKKGKLYVQVSTSPMVIKLKYLCSWHVLL